MFVDKINLLLIVQESVCDSPDQEIMETDDTTEKQGIFNNTFKINSST